jgi:hypothetical protein
VDIIIPAREHVAIYPTAVLERWEHERKAKRCYRFVANIIVALFAILIVLAALLGHAKSAAPSVVMGFVACSPKGDCSYRELEAPEGTGLMACIIHGQHAASAWLQENNMQGYTLPRGWKCYINRPGEEVPV